MSLEELANLGELINAVAVVLTLVYLAIQIRANSKHLKENTASIQGVSEISSNDIVKDLVISRTEHPELLEIQSRGDSGQELDHLEIMQYNLMTRIAFDTHQTFFIQHARGLTGDAIWEYWVRYWTVYCKFPGIRDWWSNAKDIYDPGFQIYIDELIENSHDT